jgi:hypothetical protein
MVAYRCVSGKDELLELMVDRVYGGPSADLGAGMASPRFVRYLGIHLHQRSVAVAEDVVLVVEFGEPLGHGQLVPKTLVNPGDQLSRCQLSCQQLAREGPHAGFLAGFTAERAGDEIQFVE